MASRGMYGGIPERLIQPIVIDYEHNQFKSAHTAILRLEPKYPNSAYILALKALVAERLGRRDEALQSCLEAKDKLPADTLALRDDKMLSAMQVVCQRLGRMDITIDCYDQACTTVLNNLELLLGLFNCYLRESNFKKQQQTAVKMYKSSGDEIYLLWIVCSIQLQVLHGGDVNSLFCLAEGWIKKHLEKQVLHEPEGVLFCCPSWCSD